MDSNTELTSFLLSSSPVCLHKRLGTRISGPLHFGFSDPTTQAAIAQMYSESELQAALEGSRAWNEVSEWNHNRGVWNVEELNMLFLQILSPQEKAAQEFMKIEGVGERTAMVLATTTSLGGTQHRDTDGLAKWAAEDGGAMLKVSSLPPSLSHVLFLLTRFSFLFTMKRFLLTSEEMPQSVLLWPAWSARLVPRILSHLGCEN